MDSLKRLGDICKQHYEKLILIIALIGLGGAVWYLYMENESEKEKIKEFFTEVKRKPAKGVRPADLTNYTVALTKLQNPPALDFGLPHYLLNPVKWKESPQGLIKEVTGTESGIDKLEIMNIAPLNFVIAFERTAGPGYWINVTNEVVVGGGRRLAQFATLNSTNTKVFILREVKGAADDPAELVLELKDSAERVTISKEKPFMRAEAYQADLRYPLDNPPKTFLKQRVGMTLRFGGEDYKIVTINPDEIIFLLLANDKKYTKAYKPGAAPAPAPAVTGAAPAPAAAATQ